MSDSATPQTAAHQAPRFLGFSRQEHWSGLPLPSLMHESEVAQSCPTLRDSMDCSLPGSSIHGIFQARVLEWGAIAFSEWLSIGRDKTWFSFTLRLGQGMWPNGKPTGNSSSTSYTFFLCSRVLLSHWPSTPALVTLMSLEYPGGISS